uniref:Putative ovule protein n=1 Tax=Solanum chacoense TaxID=4108 RepID=A0A0V0GZA7_SOLCH
METKRPSLIKLRGKSKKLTVISYRRLQTRKSDKITNNSLPKQVGGRLYKILLTMILLLHWNSYQVNLSRIKNK